MHPLDSVDTDGDITSGRLVEALGTMVPRLLERTHRMEPSDTFSVLAEEAATVGLDDLHFYLIDKEQSTLVAAHDSAERVPVVGTVFGDAYTNQRMHWAEGDTTHRITVPLVDGEDRLGVITAATTLARGEALGIGRVIAALAAETIVTKDSYTDVFERIRRTEPTTIAAEMRWASLPPLTFRSARASIAGIVTPSYAIAGDAFDYAVNGDVAHLAIFDAVGHELEAARVANLAIAAYRHQRRVSADLAATARSIDDALVNQFQRDTFVTALLAELDLDSGWLRWVNAGHPRPIILRHGKIVADLVTKPMPPFGLGMLPAEVEIGATRLEPRDSLLLFSDGITEAREPGGEFFGVSRLAEHLVRSTSSGLVRAETLRRLVGRLLEFQGGPLRDDATLLLVTWGESES